MNRNTGIITWMGLGLEGPTGFAHRAPLPGFRPTVQITQQFVRMTEYAAKPVDVSVLGERLKRARKEREATLKEVAEHPISASPRYLGSSEVMRRVLQPNAVGARKMEGCARLTCLEYSQPVIAEDVRLPANSLAFGSPGCGAVRHCTRPAKP
jgi:hypothetical protein